MGQSHQLLYILPATLYNVVHAANPSLCALGELPSIPDNMYCLIMMTVVYYIFDSSRTYSTTLIGQFLDHVEFNHFCELFKFLILSLWVVFQNCHRNAIALL